MNYNNKKKIRTGKEQKMETQNSYDKYFIA